MSTKATVRVTLEVDLGQPWSDDCTMKQVREQATRDAFAAVKSALEGTGIRVVNIPPDGCTVTIGGTR